MILFMLLLLFSYLPSLSLLATSSPALPPCRTLIGHTLGPAPALGAPWTHTVPASAEGKGAASWVGSGSCGHRSVSAPSAGLSLLLACAGQSRVPSAAAPGGAGTTLPPWPPPAGSPRAAQLPVEDDRRQPIRDRACPVCHTLPQGVPAVLALSRSLSLHTVISADRTRHHSGVPAPLILILVLISDRASPVSPRAPRLRVSAVPDLA